MAGRRRTRAADGQVQPTLRASRPDRRREALAVKWATAQGPGERLVVAARYVQGALTRRHPDPRAAEQITRRVEQLAQQLVELGDQALGAQASEPLHPGRRHAA